VLLGSRSLEGLNLRVDPVRKQLIDAGPAPAAAAQWQLNEDSTPTRFQFLDQLFESRIVSH